MASVGSEDTAPTDVDCDAAAEADCTGAALAAAPAAGAASTAGAGGAGFVLMPLAPPPPAGPAGPLILGSVHGDRLIPVVAAGKNRLAKAANIDM